MNKLASLALAALLLLAPQAQAATLATSALGEGVSFSLVDALDGTGNFDLSNVPSGLSSTSGISVGPADLTLRNAGLAVGSSSQNYTAPKVLGSDEAYLSVFGLPNKGAALFTVNGSYTTLSFAWGSVDSYNTLEVWDGEGKNYTLTGDTLKAALPSIALGSSDQFFTFTSLAGITKFILSSTNNSFEAAHFALSNVPLPAALPMFAVALLGVAALRRRKSA